MKRIFTSVLIVILATFMIATSGCGRQPTSKRTTDLIEKHFHKYSKRHEESILGKYPITDIKLLHTEEIHKHLIAAYTILYLKNGPALQTRITLQKKHFGWRVNSWENLGMATLQQ